jgi:preprotein translocase SecE subunit
MLTRIYKPGQGKYTRLCTALVVAVIVGLGCYFLNKMLEANDVSRWVSRLLPVVMGAVLTGVALWLVNKPAVADFMIAAEGELKKVNWSSRKEVAVSTLVVIIVVVVMAVLLGATDTVFSLIFSRLIG